SFEGRNIQTSNKSTSPIRCVEATLTVDAVPRKCSPRNPRKPPKGCRPSPSFSIPPWSVCAINAAQPDTLTPGLQRPLSIAPAAAARSYGRYKYSEGKQRHNHQLPFTHVVTKVGETRKRYDFQ